MLTLDARALVPRPLGTGTKWCCVFQVPKYHLVLGGAGTVPEFLCEYLEKRSVHISDQRESHSGTVLGHQV